jgi:ribosomal protein L40E
MRIEHDAYQTPGWCVDALMPMLDLDSKPYTFMEPCRGKGAIFDRFAPGAAMTDWCEIDESLYGESRDYLQYRSCRADLVVTNPPFSHAMEFLEKSLSGGHGTVIYLMRLSMFGSASRMKFWNLIPPSHVIVLTPRPVFCWICETSSCKAKYPPGTEKCEDCHSKVKPQSDNSEYAWFAWDRQRRVKAPNWLTVVGKPSP